MLSVIIPVYNGEKFIGRSVHSLLRCPYEQLEIIVVDDGSTDQTADVCRHLADMDKRIRYIFQENKGVSAARNRGIQEASADRVLFLDCDDWLNDGWWEKIDFEAEEYKDLLVFSFSKAFNNKSEKLYTLRKQGALSHKKLIDIYLLTDDLNSAWGKIYRKSFLHKNQICFPEGVKIGEDAIFVGKVLEHTKDFEYIDWPLYFYFENEQSATHMEIRDFRDKEALFDFKEKILEKYLSEYHLDAERFYLKFFGDFLSVLRQAANIGRRKFMRICVLASKEQYVKRFRQYPMNKAGLRRRMQKFLFCNSLYLPLYYTMKLELALLLLKKRGDKQG